jgi:hypothetical protein
MLKVFVINVSVPVLQIVHALCIYIPIMLGRHVMYILMITYIIHPQTLTAAFEILFASKKGGGSIQRAMTNWLF